MAGGVSGTEIRSGGASGGVLTETKPGMAAEKTGEVELEAELKRVYLRFGEMGIGNRDQRNGTAHLAEPN